MGEISNLVNKLKAIGHPDIEAFLSSDHVRLILAKFPESSRDSYVAALKHRSSTVMGKKTLIHFMRQGDEEMVRMPEEILAQHYTPALSRLLLRFAEEMERSESLVGSNIDDFGQLFDSVMEGEKILHNMMLDTRLKRVDASLDHNTTLVGNSANSDQPISLADSAFFEAFQRCRAYASDLYQEVMETCCNLRSFHDRSYIVTNLLNFETLQGSVINAAELYKKGSIISRGPGVTSINSPADECYACVDKVIFDIVLADIVLGRDSNKGFSPQCKKALEKTFQLATGRSSQAVVGIVTSGNSVNFDIEQIPQIFRRELSKLIGSKKYGELTDKRNNWLAAVAKEIGIEFKQPSPEVSQ